MRKIERQPSVSAQPDPRSPIPDPRHPAPGARHSPPALPTEIRTIGGVERRVTICPAGVAEGAFTSESYWRRAISRYARAMTLEDAAAMFDLQPGRKGRPRTAGRPAEAAAE